MATPEQIGWAIRTLQKRAQELGYPPKKADFDDATRARIKTFLGPWPRALEQAGLKPTPPNGRKQKAQV
ncbi:MAG: hypothetical protein E7470_07465 [Ruminococcaceae bacterium]|jgi:hypothetical protein|nr:hypothetical protein [Oscillospiraceae bacterium]